MNIPDPFAHGTPVGDDHTWIDPGRVGCADCECCIARLCQIAQLQGTTCRALVTDTGPDTYDVTRCPCAPATE